MGRRSHHGTTVWVEEGGGEGRSESFRPIDRLMSVKRRRKRGKEKREREGRSKAREVVAGRVPVIQNAGAPRAFIAKIFLFFFLHYLSRFVCGITCLAFGFFH